MSSSSLSPAKQESDVYKMENEQELGLFTDAWFTREFARFKREGKEFMED